MFFLLIKNWMVLKLGSFQHYRTKLLWLDFLMVAKLVFHRGVGRTLVMT